MVNRLNEAMKAGDMCQLSLEDLDDVSGGSKELSDLLVAANQACKEIKNFSDEMV